MIVPSANFMVTVDEEHEKIKKRDWQAWKAYEYGLEEASTSQLNTPAKKKKRDMKSL